MIDKEIATKILRVLETERFSRWYSEGGRFDSYIRGDLEHETGMTHSQCKEEIIGDIVKFFENR